MDSIHLHGAEDVRSAGHTIAGAANTMQSAVYNLECALQRQQEFMAEWLQRFEAAVERMPHA